MLSQLFCIAIAEHLLKRLAKNHYSVITVYVKKCHHQPEEIITFTMMSLCDMQKCCHEEDSHTQDGAHATMVFIGCQDKTVTGVDCK